MEQEKYLPMLNGPGTNLFGQVEIRQTDIKQANIKSDVHRIRVNSFDGCATVQHGDLTLYIDESHELEADLSVGAHKLFDLLVWQLTQQNSRKSSSPNVSVELSLDDYMAMCSNIPLSKIGKSSKDTARKLVKKYLKVLSRVNIKWEETVGKDTSGYQRQRLLDGWTYEQGIIKCSFSEKLAKYLTTHAYITQYPSALLRLDARNSTAYYLGKKLSFHYGLSSNVRNHRNNTISIASLIDATPSLHVESDPSHWKRNVRDTFERSMNDLVEAGVIDKWGYRLGRNQHNVNIAVAAPTYAKFLKLYINFEIQDFPLPVAKKRKSHIAA